jgi:hypothetical protein
MVTNRFIFIGGPDHFKISGSDRGPDGDILFDFQNILLL